MRSALFATGRLGSRAAGGFAILLAALVAAGLLTLGGPAPATAGSQRPNVVVVMTDDQDVGSTSVMHMVNRRLAGHGVTFKNFFTTFPLCCPSRATYLTGQYSHNNGVTDHRGFQQLDQSETTAVALHHAGYRTAWVGKFLNGYPSFGRQHPKDIPAGFSRWFGEVTGRMFNPVIDDNGTLHKFPRSDRNYLTDIYARTGARFIRQSAHSGKPFWLTVATLAPHGEPKRKEFPDPRPAPQDKGKFRGVKLPRSPSFNEKDVSDKPPFLQRPRLTSEQRDDLRARYRSRLASLLAVDRLVGTLLHQLRRTGELNNTWIMFTSDNGYMLGQHRLVGKTKLYDESAKVPLIIRGPAGAIPRGVVRPQMTGNIDLSPTILDITGVAPKVNVDGVSLLPFANSSSTGKNRNILLENQVSKAVRAPGWMYAEHDPLNTGTPSEFELYDLKKDPHALHNRYEASQDAGAHPGLAAQRVVLKTRLDHLKNCAGHGGGDPCD